MAVDSYTTTLTWARRKYGREIGAGFDRYVFGESPAYVVKVPRDAWGEFCNEGEAREAPTSVIFARCKAFKHPRTGVVLLRMERIVRFPTARTKLPDWTDGIDCQQVGWTADGRLVAYDWVYPRR